MVLPSANIFSKSVCLLFFSIFSRNIRRVSSSLDPDLGPNCLQRLSADDTSK